MAAAWRSALRLVHLQPLSSPLRHFRTLFPARHSAASTSGDTGSENLEHSKDVDEFNEEMQLIFGSSELADTIMGPRGVDRSHNGSSSRPMTAESSRTIAPHTEAHREYATPQDAHREFMEQQLYLQGLSEGGNEYASAGTDPVHQSSPVPPPATGTAGEPNCRSVAASQVTGPHIIHIHHYNAAAPPGSAPASTAPVEVHIHIHHHFHGV